MDPDWFTTKVCQDCYSLGRSAWECCPVPLHPLTAGHRSDKACNLKRMPQYLCQPTRDDPTKVVRPDFRESCDDLTMDAFVVNDCVCISIVVGITLITISKRKLIC
jgi:hypothetical protein